ncbi:UNVERIFIED_CONTAM: hypothetical protein Sindi_2451500 [Sesamum indicum]
MVSILIHGLKKGPFASALARDPPTNVEQLMRLVQKYINEEEMNVMKDGEWLGGSRGRDHDQGKEGSKQKLDRGRDMQGREEERPAQPKYHKYTPLITSREQAMKMIEDNSLLQWPSRARTSGRRDSREYCKFHRDRGHDTEDCHQLKDEIERLIRQGYFREIVFEARDRGQISPSRSHGRSSSKDR